MEDTAVCQSGNDYNGLMGLRISSIFIILIGSFFGAWFPVFASRHRGVGVPEWAFFIAKYFGSGVIVATAFIHLLAPAVDALTDPCLKGPITEYDWAEGIALMTIFILFFVEILTMRYAKFGHSHEHEHEHDAESAAVQTPYQDHQDDHHHHHGPSPSTDKELAVASPNEGAVALQSRPHANRGSSCPTTPHTPGDDHLGHSREHTDNDEVALGSSSQERKKIEPESYAAQMTAIFILEFGVIFHSVFIGLTLAVAGDEFKTLYVVPVFHQTFEGLALGTRLATVPWPKSKYWTPYILATSYAVSTPIAIAIGLAVRRTYPPNSQTTLIVNGCFDSISAGILIYTGLVELMAHEFMFSPYMQHASIKTVLAAFGTMCIGAGLMALLGKWA